MLGECWVNVVCWVNLLGELAGGEVELPGFGKLDNRYKCYNYCTIISAIV